MSHFLPGRAAACLAAASFKQTGGLSELTADRRDGGRAQEVGLTGCCGLISATAPGRDESLAACESGDRRGVCVTLGLGLGVQTAGLFGMSYRKK